jgi:hypothetical protein
MDTVLPRSEREGSSCGATSSLSYILSCAFKRTLFALHFFFLSFDFTAFSRIVHIAGRFHNLTIAFLHPSIAPLDQA